MQNKVITLTSDFGDSFAPAQIELVIHGINPNIRFVKGENTITQFSIVEGAFVLLNLYQFAPKESVHIAVIDPGVGSDRKGLIIKTRNHWFVGPDNGLLYPAAQVDGIEATYVIDENKVGTLSNTFHGRDIFAKVAAYISKDNNLNEFCREIPVEQIVKLSLVENQVVNIDPYGNIKIFRRTNDFKIGQTVKVMVKNSILHIPFHSTYADVEKGSYLAYRGSHNVLELALNQDSAAKRLKLSVGDIIQIESDK